VLGYAEVLRRYWQEEKLLHGISKHATELRQDSKLGGVIAQ